MRFDKIKLNPRAKEAHDRIEARFNRTVREYDRIRGALRIGGRAANYDDLNYEFVGGAKDELRKKHYDKSLRLLWKAEVHMPWSTFKDATRDESALMEMADKSLSKAERSHVERIRSSDFRELLNAEYTQTEKQAIVNILSLIGHGEAYAWLVSAEVLQDVKSTGGRSALTMQVFEEAKHFVVLRELIQAFDCPIPRMSAWEYLLLESILKAKGLEKFFGMNVVVEGFALNLFGMMSTMPGLEILKLFHLDESRHTALPWNYFKEFPMTEWQKKNPAARLRRFRTLLPAIPVLYQVEADLAELGIDSFEFGGSMVRKILHLCDRVGFTLPVENEKLAKFLNFRFNAYCKLSRYDHVEKDYFSSETTKGEEELAVERAVFQLGDDKPPIAAE